jgi:hypothetical protein
MTSKAPVQQQPQRRCPCPLEQLTGYLPLIHGGRDRRRPRSVRRANPSPWAASQPKPATRFPGPCHRSGPRTRLGCLTGSAVVSTCCQQSSGSWATRCRRSCSKAPQSQRTLRLNSLWSGGLQFWRTSSRKAASPGRARMCRTGVGAGRLWSRPFRLYSVVDQTWTNRSGLRGGFGLSTTLFLTAEAPCCQEFT